MATAIFVQNFTLTANYYGCTPAEVEAMKESARRDMGNAETCFAVLAAEAREAGIPLDQSGAIAAEVNRQRRGR